MSNSGGIGGAANELGSAHRRGAAAYVMAHGLVGNGAKEFGCEQHDHPIEIALETEDAVDDICFKTESGRIVLVQAKHHLDKSSLRSVIGQWCDAIRSGDVGERDRLVACFATAINKVDDVARALRRLRDEHGPSLTKGQQSALCSHFYVLVKEWGQENGFLSRNEVQLLLRTACFAEVDAKENELKHAKYAAEMLNAAVVRPGHGDTAFKALRDEAEEHGWRRSGSKLADWLTLLRHSPSVELVADPEGSPAARHEHLERLLTAYREFCVQKGYTLRFSSLGFQISDADIREIDIGVRVGREEDTDRPSMLAFEAALRRRGRVVLRGLPGSGKSTLLRRTLGELGDNTNAPVPIYLKLTTFHSRLEDGEDPVSALVNAGLRDFAHKDKSRLRGHFEELLMSGGVALLLDGLDETSDMRHKVVDELLTAFGQFHPDTEIAVATRDVAYADAARFGFHTLKVTKPYWLTTFIEAFLEHASTDAMIASESYTERAKVRVEWINEHLDHAAYLKETPLIPVLLTLLAAQQNPDKLPSTREAVLERIVTQVVERWEIQTMSHVGKLVGGLDREAAMDMLFHGYAIIAKDVLDYVSPTATQIERSLVSYLDDEWSLSKGRCRVTARQIREFWDERGIFVAEGADEIVTAPIQLLAEIGYVRLVDRQDSQWQQQWFQRSLSNKELVEVVRLAAEKVPMLCDELIEFALDSKVPEQIENAVQVVLRGGQPGSEATEGLVEYLLTSVRSESFELRELIRWLAHLPSEDQMFARVDQVLQSSLTGDERLVWQMWAGKNRPNLVETKHDDLRRFVLQHLNARAQRKPLKSLPNEADFHLDDLFLWACRQLFSATDTGFIRNIASQVYSSIPARTAKQFVHLLPANIRDEWHERASSGDSATNFMKTVEVSNASDRFLLKVLATGAQHADLSLGKRRKLDELSALFSFLSPGHAPINEFPTAVMNHPDEMKWFIRLVCRVCSFDSQTAAAQAAHALGELDEGYAVASLLRDEPSTPAWTDWEVIFENCEVLDRIIAFFGLDSWFANRVAPFLVDFPVSDELLPKLKPYLETLSGERHYDAAQLYIAHVPVHSDVPEQWLSCSSWSRRAALGTWANRLADEKSEEEAAKLLARLMRDPDRLVRRLVFWDANVSGFTAALPSDVDEPPAYESCYYCGEKKKTCGCKTHVRLKSDDQFEEIYG